MAASAKPLRLPSDDTQAEKNNLAAYTCSGQLNLAITQKEDHNFIYIPCYVLASKL